VRVVLVLPKDESFDD